MASALSTSGSMDGSLFLGKGFRQIALLGGQGPMSRPGEAGVCECVSVPVNEVRFQCALLEFSQCMPAHVCIERGIGEYRGRLHSKDPRAGNEKMELLVLRALLPLPFTNLIISLSFSLPPV